MIGLQGMLYFLGFLVGALIWLRLADFVGRKPLLVGGGLAHVLLLLAFFVSVSPLTLYLFWFFTGFIATIKFNVFYILFMEVLPAQ